MVKKTKWLNSEKKGEGPGHIHVGFESHLVMIQMVSGSASLRRKDFMDVWSGYVYLQLQEFYMPENY